MIYSKRFYCFENDQFLKNKIEEVRGNVKFETLEPKYAYIIHKAILSKTYNNEYEKKGFSILKKTNRELLGSNPNFKYSSLSYLFGGNDKSIKQIVDNLINWKVIKVHRKYRPKHRATSYKLRAAWENREICLRKYSGKKNSIIYKLNEKWNERLKVPIVQSTQDIYDRYISLSDAGIKFIQEKYNDSRIDIIAEALRNGTFDDNKEQLQTLLDGFPVERNDVILISFFLKQFYCSPIGRGKRLYHSITNLKREYRNYVLINGHPIMEVDITNSQPTFAAAFLIGLYLKLPKLQPELFTDGDFSIPEDLLNMMRLCRKGLFYERIAEEAGIVLNSTNRGNFKEDFFRDVFYSKVTESRRVIKTAFKALFPNVYEMIVGIKRKNYKEFPVLMQDLEADVMVYHVYSKLLEEGHIVLVLHDAILCSTHAAVVRSKELIREAFRCYFGQEISFKGDMSNKKLIKTSEIA